MTHPAIALKNEMLNLVEHEIRSRGGSNCLVEAADRLDDIDCIEILFAIEDHFDLDLNDNLLDAGPREFVTALFDGVNGQADGGRRHRIKPLSIFNEAA